MFVITADQHASQRDEDRVPAILAALAETGLTPIRAFERTVGDEIQGILASAADVLGACERLHRHGHWAVGIGLGAADELAGTAAASRGPVFVAARAAVERARGKAVPVPVAVETAPGERTRAADHAEALAQLLASVQRRRSAAGWEAIDLLPGSSQAAVAERLGISPAAVSQRLRAAQWAEARSVEPLLSELLDAAHAAALETPTGRPADTETRED